MNLVRCKLPEGVKRFPMINVSEYRDMLMVRTDMENRSDEEQKKIMDEMIEEMFPDLPENYRDYVFATVYLSSIGNTYIPIVVKCDKCGKEIKLNVNFEFGDLNHIDLQTKYGIRLKIKFPETKCDMVDHITNNILEVTDSVKTYKWEELSEIEQISVVSTIDFDSMKEFINKSNPLYKKITLKCCSNENIVIELNDIVSMFKLFIHPDEISNFYKINHRLSQNNYDYNNIMSMKPMERTLALSLVEHDLKEANNK